jgi:hypothetical protein
LAVAKKISRIFRTKPVHKCPNGLDVNERGCDSAPVLKRFTPFDAKANCKEKGLKKIFEELMPRHLVTAQAGWSATGSMCRLVENQKFCNSRPEETMKVRRPMKRYIFFAPKTCAKLDNRSAWVAASRSPAVILFSCAKTLRHKVIFCINPH